MMPTTYYTLPGRAPKVESRSEKITQWVLQRRAQIALALGVAVVAGALAAMIVSSRRKLEEASVLQLTAARFKAGQGNLKEAHQNLDNILRAQRGSVAMQAYLLKGELLVQEGRYDEALKNYEAGVLNAAVPEYKTLLRAGQAAALVELKQYAEAAAQYDSLLKDNPDHYLVPRWYMEVARLRRELKQKDAASAALERLLTLYPKSPWAAGAQAMLEEFKPSPATKNN